MGFFLDAGWKELIQNSKNSYIAALVERHSRYVMLAFLGENYTN